MSHPDFDSTDINRSPAGSAPKLRAWIATGLVAAFVLGFTAAIGYRVWAQPQGSDASAPQQEHPLFPPGVSLKATAKPVIGNLGGLPVTFPAGFASNVEYDGDPEFGYKRNGPVPPRTHQSGIRSMGFELKYPDFAVTTTRDRELDKRNYKIYDTPWIRFHVTASSDFGDGQFLERSFAQMNEDRNFQYKKLSSLQHGLQVYSPYTVDKSLRNYRHGYGYLNDMRDRDIFFSFDEEGKVKTFIRCNNVNHAAAPCSQSFYLNPKFRLKLTASYRREMLPHWQEIQRESKKLIYQFQANN